MATEISKLFVTIGAKTDDFRKGMEDISGSLKKTGAILMGIGAAITGVLALSVKAAAEEEAGIERLRVAMGNVGLAYDGASGALEKWIDAQQQSTAFADDEQRAALSSLIILTKDLTKAQKLLTIAFDVARWKQLDLKTATDLLMKVYAGDMGLLKRYGIIVTEGATAVEALAQIQTMAAGQAEAYGKTVAGQFELMRNNIGDLKEAIGTALLPAVGSILEKLNAFIQFLKGLNPELVKFGVIALAVAGILALLGGGLLLIIGFLPTIAAGFALLSTLTLPKLITLLIAATKAVWAYVASLLAALAAMGPWGWAMLATGIGLIATGVTLAARHSKEAQQEVASSFGDSEVALTKYSAEVGEATAVLGDYTSAVQEATMGNIGLGEAAGYATIQFAHQLQGAEALAWALKDIWEIQKMFSAGIPEAVFTARYGPAWAWTPWQMRELGYMGTDEQLRALRSLMMRAYWKEHFPEEPYPPRLPPGWRKQTYEPAAYEYGGMPLESILSPMTITNTFNISELRVREDADVKRIAEELFRLQNLKNRTAGINI